jgi:hypothetical protein
MVSGLKALTESIKMQERKGEGKTGRGTLLLHEAVFPKEGNDGKAREVLRTVKNRQGRNKYTYK